MNCYTVNHLRNLLLPNKPVITTQSSGNLNSFFKREIICRWITSKLLWMFDPRNWSDMIWDSWVVAARAVNINKSGSMFRTVVVSCSYFVRTTWRIFSASDQVNSDIKILFFCAYRIILIDQFSTYNHSKEIYIWNCIMTYHAFCGCKVLENYIIIFKINFNN